MKCALLFILIAGRLLAATPWYVNGANVSGTYNGTSWATGWQTIAQMTTGRGVMSSGDTVYISGGASGGSITYIATSDAGFDGQWNNMVNGVTYQIGQDSAHNGTAIFDAGGNGSWLQHDHTGVTLSGDAGDGLMHIKLKDNSITAAGGVCNNTSGFHITYVDFGTQNANPGTSFLNFNPGHAIEVDHCYSKITGDTANQWSYGQFDGTVYDENKFHHNTILIPHTTGNEIFGADGLGWGGSSPSTGGISIYNNTITAFNSATYSGNQHQDGWQVTSGASYVKIYNNRFTDMGNYWIYPESFTGSYSHCRYYDNVGSVSFTNNTQAIAVNASLTYVCTDIVCANNTADGYATPFTFRNPVTNPLPGAWSACFCYNNVGINGGTNVIDPTVTNANNVYVTSGSAPSYFTSWIATGTGSGSPSNAVYTLLAGASTLIHTGTNVSSYGITTDFTGASFANPPSIGAYEFGGSGSTGGSSMLGKIALSGNFIIK